MSLSNSEKLLFRLRFMFYNLKNLVYFQFILIEVFFNQFQSGRLSASILKTYQIDWRKKQQLKEIV